MASSQFLKKTRSGASSSSSSHTAPIPEGKEEAMSAYRNPDLGSLLDIRGPEGVDTLVTHSLGGDINLDTATVDQRNHFRLFDRPIDKLMHPDPEASVIGNLILRGEEKDVEEALALIAKKVEKDPSYMRWHVIAADPLGRKAKATFVGLAAMGGDVDLKAEIKEDKDRGLVERIVKISNLSDDEVREQLNVINSDEAKAANDRRKERIVSAVKRFGVAILLKSKEYKGDIKDYNNFKAFQVLCKPLIEQLERDLTPDPAEIVTSGYIYDPAVLAEALQWFEDHLNGCRLFLMSSEEKEIHSDTNNLRLHFDPTKGLFYYFKGVEYNFKDELTSEQRKTIEGLFRQRELFGKDIAHLEGLHQAVCKALLAITSKRGHTPDLTGFGGWWTIISDVFWVNGFGKLQSKLSSRDAQITNEGIGYVVDDGRIPPRTLVNRDRHTYFFNSSSLLGRDFYLGYYAGAPALGAPPPGRWLVHGLVGKLMSIKNSSIANLCNSGACRFTPVR